MQMVAGTPRRNRADLWTEEEQAIADAIEAVEGAGAHPLLTDAVVLLTQAADKVADWVERPPCKDCSEETTLGLRMCRSCGRDLEA